MSAEMILRITCDYCDTQILLPVREAVEGLKCCSRCANIHGPNERTDTR